MKKFTPGPWAASIASSKEMIHIYQRKNGFIVATIPTTNCEQNEANAHLLSASPELLKALKEVTWEVENNYLDFMDETSVGFKAVKRIVGRARKAIGKAEGK